MTFARSLRLGLALAVTVAVAWRHRAYRSALLSNFATGWSLFGLRFALVPLFVEEVLDRQPRHVAGLDKLTTGPRRTPMIKIAVALAAATVNIRAQQNHRPGAVRAESIDVRTRQLGNHLGYPPARIPPRS